MAGERRTLQLFRRNSGTFFVVLVALVIAAVLFVGGVSVRVGDADLRAGATLAGGRAISWGDVLSVSYIDNPDFGVRESGVLGWRVHAGTYISELWGAYQLYAYARVNACIDVETASGHVVFNAATVEETKRLYDQVRAHVVQPEQLMQEGKA